MCHADKQPKVAEGCSKVLKYPQKMDSILLYWAVLWLRWLNMWCLTLSDKILVLQSTLWEAVDAANKAQLLLQSFYFF